MLFIRYLSVQSLYEQDPLVTWAWQDQSVFHFVEQAVLLSQLTTQLPQTIAVSLLSSVAIILPSEAVSLHSIDLPQVQKKHLMKAIPYVLEEKLAEDVERLHFVFSAIEFSKLSVAVISKELLQRCLEQLHYYHFYPVTMVSEASLLLNDNSVQQVFLEGEKAFIRTASESIITLAKEQIATILPKLLSLSESDSLLEGVQELSLHYLCEAYSFQVREKKSLNILQGHFKQKSKKNISSRRLPWRSVLVLFSILVLIKLSLYTWEILYYGHQAEVSKQRSVELYKHYFPQTKRIRDVKRELKAKLRELNNNGDQQSDFLFLLSKIQQPLADFTKNNGLSINIQSLSYDQSQRQLRIDLSLPDFPALDKLKKSLEQSGLIMLIDAANQDNNEVKARIKLGAV